VHEDLARLERLDTLDRDITAREKEIARLAEELAQAEVSAAGALEALALARAAVEENDQAQRANTRRTREYEQRKASAIRILEMGSGDPDAAERQRTSCEALIDEAETEMLELMEEADQRAEALSSAEQAQTEADAALQTARAEVPERTRALQAEIAELRERRPAVLGELPSDIRSRYEAFRARGKWAVAQIVRDACKACRMEIRAQHLADLRKGRIEPCHGCHRWLIPDRELV